MKILLATAFFASGFFYTKWLHAHSWYDPACCSNQDCEPVDNAVVKATPDGWLVTVKPGDHSLAVRSVEKLFLYRGAPMKGSTPWARPSLDDNFHVCISKYTGDILCLYVPEMEV